MRRCKGFPYCESSCWQTTINRKQWQSDDNYPLWASMHTSFAIAHEHKSSNFISTNARWQWQHLSFTGMAITMAMAMININNKALCTSARQLHIASCNNNDNNNVATKATYIVYEPLFCFILVSRDRRQKNSSNNNICCWHALCAFHIALGKALRNHKALCTSAQYYHIVLRNGDNDNNTSVTTTYVVNKPLVRKRTIFILQHITLCNGNNNKATTVTTKDECQQQSLKHKRTTCSHQT